MLKHDAGPNSPVADPAGTASAPIFQCAFDALPMSAVIVDARGTIIAANQAWQQFATDNGGAPDSYLGTNYLDVCNRASDKQAPSVAEHMHQIITGAREQLALEYPCHSPDSRRWFIMQASRLECEGRVYALVCHTDITQRRLAEEDAYRLAGEDALTGLLNRRSFEERLTQALHRAERRGTELAVLFLDLDGFKAINDELGHATGDQVLCDFGKRMQQSLRRVDCLCRLGGDEFTMFLEEAGIDTAVRVAQRIHAIVREDIEVEGQKVNLDASIGVSLFPKHGDDPQSLLDAADTAMYKAKAEGAGMTVAD